MKPNTVRSIAGIFLTLALLGCRAHGAQLFPTGTAEWRYQLLGDSTYLNDCPPCERPSFYQPLRGSFLLTAGRSDPLFTRFNLSEVHFVVGGNGPGAVHLDGTGELEVGGEVALIHRLSLDLTVSTSDHTEVVRFESGGQPGEPHWPWLNVALTEVDPSAFRVLHLDLAAMPLRALWFSTPHGLTASLPGPKPLPVSGGDLLSDDGRVVVNAASVGEALAIQPPDPLLNLDAVDVLPGGLLQFSLLSDAASMTLGTLHHGDLLALDGTRVKSYTEFALAIGPQPPAPDLGLDAIHALGDGTLLFSTTQDIFSERLGVFVGRGDVVSTSGRLWRRNAELLNAFKPLKPLHDYGLDALYVWPNGEVWFSTEEPVELPGLPSLSDGDLLSDTGRVVYRNLELLAGFSPLEDLANFGLDALVVATDATDAAKPPALQSVHVGSGGTSVRFEWTGPGRFFQVEQASAPAGPFAAVTPLVIGSSVEVPVGSGPAFFRLRQW